MADQIPIPIDGISDPDLIRVKLLASGKDVHAPMSAFAAAAVHGAPTKATPVDADEFGYWDSVGLQAVKLTWANLKEGMRAFFYGANKVTPVDSDVVGMLDSATTFSPKYSTWAQIKATMIAALGTAATVNTGTTTGTIPLNDVGTFTPAFSATGATFSHSIQQGTYTKIGRVVFFQINMLLNTSGNTLTANALTITGLPFTVTFGGQYIVRWTNSTTAFIGVLARAPTSNTILIIETWTAATTSNGGTAGLANTVLHATNGSALNITGQYYI